MKRILLRPLPILLLALAACGSDDDGVWPAVDGERPTVVMENTVIPTGLGETFHIKGKVTDADGIRYVDLTSLPLALKKRIDITAIYGEPLKEYELDYKVTTDLTEAGDSFDVEVTATDVLGNTTSQTVKVEMTGTSGQ